MDSKIKSKWLLAVIMFLVLAGIIIHRAKNTLSTVTANTGHNVAQVSTVSGSEQAEFASLSPDDFTNSCFMRSDGFKQPAADSSEAAPRIEAIFISASGKSSIYMNGQYAYEGDIVEGFKVLKIYPDKAEFEKNNKITTSCISVP